MSRRLHLVALAAVPALLAACDSTPSALSKAKPGECYAVVGRDAAGSPTLSKTPCPGSPAAIAAACPAPSVAQAAGAATPTACLPTAGQGATSTAIVTAGRGEATGVTRALHRTERSVIVRRSSGQTSHSVQRHRVVRSNGGSGVAIHRDYARVDDGLAGGPNDYGQHYERREYARRDDYAPPPPAFDRYNEREEYGYSQGRRESHGYRSEGHGYSSGRKTFAPPPPPPPAYEHHAYGRGSVAYAERQRSSSSYRAESYSSSSSSRSRVEVDCDCDHLGHGREPNPSPFDHNGFLTWRGKTPG